MSVLGAGRHKVNVVGHQLGRSGGEKQTPYVAVLFESEQTIGDRITWYGYLSDAAFERTVSTLRLLGWEPELHDGRLESLHNTDLLHGREADIVVELEDYNGQARPKVKWVNALGGGGLGEGMAADEVLQFSNTMRQKILSAKGPQPSARPGPSRQPAAAGAGNNRKPLNQPDDDLPF